VRIIAALALAFAAVGCGTATVVDERRTIDGVDCVVVGRSGGDGVGISCNWEGINR
jgi:hypothetical protein